MFESKPVLIVEDDRDFAVVLASALADIGAANPVRWVGDGKAAIDLLLGTGPYADRAAHPAPGLILLDLKLPGMTGFAVLRWLRKGADRKRGLGVVVLTARALADTAHVVAELGADEFIEKPLGYGELRDRLRGVAERWLKPEPLPVS